MTRTRKRPAPTDRPFPNYTRAPKSNGHSPHRRVDGFAAPDAEDRREAALLVEAAECGYRLAVQCLDCRRGLTAPTSVAHHRGPLCRRRAAS